MSSLRRKTGGDLSDVRITFGIIALNAEPFLRYNLRALYSYAHQIIVVEGSAPASSGVASIDGHSNDGTLELLRQFVEEEDIDGKILIVTAEDVGHTDGFWSEKDEMSRAYAERATGNFLWQVDADEFYLPRDMDTVINLLRSDPYVTGISFPMRTFWGSPAYVVDGYFLNKFTVDRVFAWRPGFRYTSHRPPTVVDENGVDLRTIKWLRPEVMRAKGVYMFHYELLFPKQVLDKCVYYAAVDWTHTMRDANEWAQRCYFELGEPFRVHMMYRHVSWLNRYQGVHPPQVVKMVEEVRLGKHHGVSLRPSNDVELLLANRSYSIRRIMLAVFLPVDKWLSNVKASARAVLKDTWIWSALQAVNRLRRPFALSPRHGHSAGGSQL